MSGPRRWVAAGALLGVTGALTAISTWRHWAPCRSESAARCLALQETTHGFPGWGGVGRPDPVAFGTVVAAAALLLGVVWVAVVGWSRTSVTRSLLCWVIAAQPMVAAAVLTSEWTGHTAPPAVGGWLTWPAEAYVFPLLLGAGWLLNETPRATLRLLALGWGVTSFGPVHHFGDYVVTWAISPGAPGVASPPGLGYATALTQLALGIVVIVLTLIRGSSDSPDPDDWPDRDGFTLAA